MLVVACAALAGCGTSEGATSGGDGTPAPAARTVGADPATTAAGTDAPRTAAATPTLPAAASTPDEAGVEATLTAYVDALNHAYRTGDVDLLNELVAPTCTICTSQREIAAEMDPRGLHVDGDVLRLVGVDHVAVDGESATARTEQEALPAPLVHAGRGDAEVMTWTASRSSYLVTLVFDEDHWVIESLTVQEH